jgi:hypothetical protein
MKFHTDHLCFLCLVMLGLLAPGCGPPRTDAPRDIKKVPVGQNVVMEVQGSQRRVVFPARVCKREGEMEMLLTRTNKKTHEAVLESDVDAREIHKALLLAGANKGSPVRWLPDYRPPTGTRIRVTLEYESDGRKFSVPGGSWIRHSKTRQPLNSDWVFVGSQFVDNGGQTVYLANEGDVICVANFETALLDVPFESSKDDAEHSFEAFTERIPPEDTRVTVILEPQSRKP